VLSDWLSFLAPSIISPTIYIILVYFMADLRSDHLAADLFILIADVCATLSTTSKSRQLTCRLSLSNSARKA
jgi:hypothetical protein